MRIQVPGFLLSSLIMSSQHSAPMVRSVDAIVVGAGMSGLAAARRLALEGLSVKVLEAGDRAGGRMCTVQAPGGQVELGAQFFHGTEGNPVYALALKHGLMEDVKKLSQQQAHTFNRMRAIVEGGAEADAAAVEEGSTAFETAWEELESGAAFAAGAPTDESAGAYVRRRFAEITQSSSLSRDMLDRTLSSKLRMQVLSFSPPTRTTLLHTPRFLPPIRAPASPPAVSFSHVTVHAGQHRRRRARPAASCAPRYVQRLAWPAHPSRTWWRLLRGVCVCVCVCTVVANSFFRSLLLACARSLENLRFMIYLYICMFVCARTHACAHTLIRGVHRTVDATRPRHPLHRSLTHQHTLSLSLPPSPSFPSL